VTVTELPQVEISPAEAPPANGKSEISRLLLVWQGGSFPGLGHALQKMWGRALACFLTVGVLVVLGAGMRGISLPPTETMPSTHSAISPIWEQEVFISLRNRWKPVARMSRTPVAITEPAFWPPQESSICWLRCTPMKQRAAGKLSSMGLHVTHFQSMLLFAVIISIAFGFLGRRRPLDRVKYIIWSLFLFLVIGVGIVGLCILFRTKRERKTPR